MKQKSNPESDGTDRRILSGSKGYATMQSLIVSRDSLHNYKVSFSNYFDEKSMECRLCKTKVEVMFRESDGEKYIRNKIDHHLHRVYSKKRKKMFCRLDNGKLQFCFAISKMRVDQTEDLTETKGSKKRYWIDKITNGMKTLTDEDKKELDIPERLISLSGLKLQELYDNMVLRL